MVASRAHLLTILEKAVQDGVVPGVGVVAGQAGLLSVREVVGWRQVSPAAEGVATPLPATLDTLWDLASLTKALVTSVLAMQAVESGALALDQPLGVAPAGASPAVAADITVRRVLAHAGGFAAHLPFWETAVTTAHPAGHPAARAAVVAAAGRTPLLHPPGTHTVYSDLGFILLGDLLERVLGDRLDRLAEKRLGPAFGRPSLAFRPIGPAEVVAPNNDIAATTLCPTRGRVSRGEVDDRNAWAMGGVAGHAGLFGTLDAVASAAWALLAAYRGAGPAAGVPPVVGREVLRLFFSPAGIPDAASTWRLGWEGPAARNSLAGDLIARSGVGHLAFTGCSLWMDPDREAFVAVVSNRHHPHVTEDKRFRDLRRAVNDTALAVAGY